MRFNATYQLGYDGALKEAGIKSIAKNTALAGLITAGGAGGAKTGGNYGRDLFAQRAYPQFHEVLSSSPKVDAPEFLAAKGSGIKHFTPDTKGLKGLASEFQKRKLIASSINLEEIAEAMKTTKDVMDAADDLNIISYPSVDSVLSNRKSNPSLLSHEIGHIEQERLGLATKDPNSLMGVILGRQLKNEREAWERAKKMGLPIERKIEQAAIAPYEAAQKGSIAGGVAGGIGGGVGVLAMLRAMLSRKKKAV